jgi:hypothetical protein
VTRLGLTDATSNAGDFAAGCAKTIEQKSATTVMRRGMRIHDRRRNMNWQGSSVARKDTNDRDEDVPEFRASRASEA